MAFIDYVKATQFTLTLIWLFPLLSQAIFLMKMKDISNRYLSFSAKLLLGLINCKLKHIDINPR